MALESAGWDESASARRLHTSAGEFLAERLIAGTGNLAEPRLPDIPGLETFAGAVVHTSRWDHELEFAGRRIGVIGTGSSGIQVIPELAKGRQPSRLYQRTPAWVLPHPNRRTLRAERAAFRRFPIIQRADRALNAYFKGVPVGVNPQGRTVLGRLFQANWGVAGMMGSGKSTLVITTLLGAMLDSLVEIDVYCMAQNADYDPLKPRLRTLFKSDDADEIPQVLAALKQLMSELSERGRRLSAAGEPKLTRKLAEADPTMRPRVVVIDECQELFISEVGAEAAELVVKMIAKARKYGVTLIFATPVPSADSLPRNVAKVLSNKACFAIGDHQGNDAILGTGKHKAGITATDLRPMTEDADGNVDLGDLGTAMTVGFSSTDGLMRCYYVPRGDGIDEVTPVVQRALALRDGLEPAEAPDPGNYEPAADLLADVAEVMRRAGAELMRTQEVITALTALNRAAYHGFTFTQLRDGLPDAAKPYKTKGVVQVNARRIAEALADRDEDGHNTTGADHGT